MMPAVATGRSLWTSPWAVGLYGRPRWGAWCFRLATGRFDFFEVRHGGDSTRSREVVDDVRFAIGGQRRRSITDMKTQVWDKGIAGVSDFPQLLALGDAQFAGPNPSDCLWPARGVADDPIKERFRDVMRSACRMQTSSLLLVGCALRFRRVVQPGIPGRPVRPVPTESESVGAPLAG